MILMTDLLLFTDLFKNDGKSCSYTLRKKGTKAGAVPFQKVLIYY